jgi:hypothetical protein
MVWKIVSAKEEAAREVLRQERQRRLEQMRKYLRLPLEDFLSKLSINESSPLYDEIVAIWRGFHEG